MSKTYKRGFYGGKFLPFHSGHKYCIQIGASQCEEFVVLFFSKSEEETEILAQNQTLDVSYLSEEKRIEDMQRECSRYSNVRLIVLDCSQMHREAIQNGTDLWDAETKYVMDAVGEFQAVYSSEPGYDAYFKRAYPFAEHILIDPERVHVPISGTKIREMSADEAEKWI